MGEKIVKKKILEACQMIKDLIYDLPEEKRLGFIVYIYETIDNKIVYEYAGICSEFDRASRQSIVHEIKGMSMQDVKGGIEWLKNNDENFKNTYCVAYGVHAIYETYCILISKIFKKS